MDNMPLMPEPPLIERARRTGWALLALSLVAMLMVRAGPADWRTAALIIGAACGLFGFLAIINVALVRSLYRQVAEAPLPESEDTTGSASQPDAGH